jgi:hypothetical protein
VRTFLPPVFIKKLFSCLLNGRSVFPDFLTRILITFDLLLNESVSSGQLGGRWGTLLPNSLSLILLFFLFRYQLCNNCVLYDVALFYCLGSFDITIFLCDEVFLIDAIHVSYILPANMDPTVQPID